MGCRLLPLLNGSESGFEVKSTRLAWTILRALASSPASSLGDIVSLSGERLPSLSLDVDEGGVGGNTKLAFFIQKK